MPSCHAMFGFEKPRWHYISEFVTRATVQGVV